MSVVTFLFTDIDGSTPRCEAAPDAMRVALETHNETLRKAVELHAGHVFNYTGDGMCAVFDSPRSAATPQSPVCRKVHRTFQGDQHRRIVAAIIHDIRRKSRP